MGAARRAWNWIKPPRHAFRSDSLPAGFCCTITCPGGLARLAAKTETDVRLFWPAGLALALAITTVLFVPSSPARRLSNLDLAGVQLRDTFLVFIRSQADRCRVADRRNSTTRRFDSHQPSRNWDCVRIPGWVQEGVVVGELKQQTIPKYVTAGEVLGLDEFSAARVYA